MLGKSFKVTGIYMISDTHTNLGSACGSKIRNGCRIPILGDTRNLNECFQITVIPFFTLSKSIHNYSRILGNTHRGKTRHRVSTSMYSLTFCVCFLLPERQQRKPAVQAAALMLRTPPVDGQSPASQPRPVPIYGAQF